MRGVSERTIQRNWEKGRLYLHHVIARLGHAGAPCRRSALIAGASSVRISTKRWTSPTDRAGGVAAVDRARDSALAADLQAMLDEHQRCTSRAFSSDAVSIRGIAAASLAGQVVGAYRLVSPSARADAAASGSPSAATAASDGRAAVKLLNISLIGRAGEERFSREGTILARLTHPQIAHLIDAGLSPAGQPYLVLEHVDGQSIDQYCDERALGDCARLRLFLDVLDAVAHAHANLIVHRDLKPAERARQHRRPGQAARLRHREAARARCGIAQRQSGGRAR